MFSHLKFHSLMRRFASSLSDLSGIQESSSSSYLIRNSIYNYERYFDDNFIKLLLESARRRFGSLNHLPPSIISISDIATFRFHLRNYINLKNHIETLEEKLSILNDNCDNFVDTRLKLEFSSLIESKCEELKPFEKMVVPVLINLPNLVCPQVPLDNTIVKSKDPFKFDFKTLDHVKLSYINDMFYSSIVGPKSTYFVDLGARLALAISKHFISALNEMSFIQMSGLDFAKCFVVKACNSLNTEAKFKLYTGFKSQDRYDYLVGNASLESFSALLCCKKNLNKSKLPLKLMSNGTNYSYLHGQQDCVYCLIATHDDTSVSSQEMIYLIDKIWQYYDKIDIPIRLVHVGAPSLSLHEFERYDFQVWLPVTREWKICGTVSNYTDSIPTLLELDGLQFIGGLVYDSKTLICSIIENLQTKDGKIKIPEVLKNIIN